MPVQKEAMYQPAKTFIVLMYMYLNLFLEFWFIDCSWVFGFLYFGLWTGFMDEQPQIQCFTPTSINSLENHLRMLHRPAAHIYIDVCISFFKVSLVYGEAQVHQSTQALAGISHIGKN